MRSISKAIIAMRRINLKGSEVAGQSVIVAIKEDGAEFGESGDIQVLWLGSDVAVESAEGAMTAGRLIGLAPDGELPLETPSGEIVTLDRGSLIKAAPAPHAAAAAPRN